MKDDDDESKDSYYSKADLYNSEDFANNTCKKLAHNFITVIME